MEAPSVSTSFSSLFESYLDRPETATSPINVSRPEMPRRRSSAAHNALMRQLICPWGKVSQTPPACRAVSFSSWRRFSATSSNGSKSSDEMTASVLLKASGTTPDFDPPVMERCDLRVTEDLICGNPESDPKRYYPRIHHMSRQSSSSWTTAASNCSTQPGSSEAITFKKQPVRSTSKSSLLTASFKEPAPKPKHVDPPKVALERIGRQMGIEMLSLGDLPEDAFESDSEDDD